MTGLKLNLSSDFKNLDKTFELAKVFKIYRLHITIGTNVNLFSIESKKFENELAQSWSVRSLSSFERSDDCSFVLLFGLIYGSIYFQL